MELLNIDDIQILLEYGSLALIMGVVMIMVFELLIYGVVKAIGFFRL